MIKLGIATMIVVQAGCSALIVRSPSSRGKDCTHSYAPAVIDAVLATGAMVGFLIGKERASHHSCSESDVPGCGQAHTAWILPVIVFGIAAAAGASIVHGCRRFQRTERERGRSDTVFAAMVNAMRARDCERVRHLYSELSTSERDRVNAHVFRDPTMLACLDSDTSAAVQAPPTPVPGTPESAPRTSDGPPAPTAATSPPAEPHPVDASHKARVAREMIDDAKRAARAGDCAAVIRADPRIRAVDQEQYESDFVTNAAIVACLPRP